MDGWACFKGKFPVLKQHPSISWLASCLVERACIKQIQHAKCYRKKDMLAFICSVSGDELNLDWEVPQPAASLIDESRSPAQARTGLGAKDAGPRLRGKVEIAADNGSFHDNLPHTCEGRMAAFMRSCHTHIG